MAGGSMAAEAVWGWRKRSVLTVPVLLFVLFPVVVLEVAEGLSVVFNNPASC